MDCGNQCAAIHDTWKVSNGAVEIFSLPLFSGVSKTSGYFRSVYRFPRGVQTQLLIMNNNTYYYRYLSLFIIIDGPPEARPDSAEAPAKQDPLAHGFPTQSLVPMDLITFLTSSKLRRTSFPSSPCPPPDPRESMSHVSRFKGWVGVILAGIV